MVTNIKLTETQKREILSRMKPKAYSYIRWSTAEQAKGHSDRRQTELVEEYCKKHGLILEEDAQFYDRGTSGFRGKNKREGALKRFLDLAEAGEIEEGSFLLVEELDRLTREAHFEATELFQSLFKAGITIVALSTGMRFHRDMGIVEQMALTMFLNLAHEESKKKSERLRKAWKSKRDAAKGKKLTGTCPHWLKLENGAFVIDEERAAVVRKIFELTIEGNGASTVAKILNKQGIPVWGRGKRIPKYWHPSYIQKILNGRSVLGEYQPHEVNYIDVKQDGKRVKKRERAPVGDVIPDYYPRIIANETYIAAQTQVTQNAKFKAGKRSVSVSSLFSKIAFCGYCGAPMYYSDKGDYQYLVCSRAAAGSKECKRINWRYEQFEAAFLRFIEGLDFSLVLKKDRSKIEAIQAKRNAKIKQLQDTQKKRERLTNQLLEIDDAPKTLIKLIGQLEDQEEKLKDEIAALLSNVKQEEEISNNVEEDKNKIVELIHEKQDTEARQKLVIELRRKIDRILVCGGGFIEREIYQKSRTTTKEEAKLWNEAFPDKPKKEEKPDMAEYAANIASLKTAPDERFFRVVFKNGEWRSVAPIDWTNEGGYSIMEKIDD